MKKVYFFLILIGICFLSSCQQEDALENKREMKSLKVEFTYDGVFYSSNYTINPQDSSDIKFEDTEIAGILKKIESLPELATLVSNDSITYFDNQMQRDAFLKSERNIKTRASIEDPINFYLSLYEHDTFRGRVFNFGGGNTYTSAVGVSDLKTVNFGDIMSSFIFESNTGARVTFYEHDTYRGASITFTAKPRYSVSNMNDYRYGGVLGIGSHRWGDKVSSFMVN